MPTPELTELERLQQAVRETYDALTRAMNNCTVACDTETANGNDVGARKWGVKEQTYSLARAQLKSALYGNRVHVEGVTVR